MGDTAISDTQTSLAAPKQLDVYLIVYVPCHTSTADWSLWICHDENAASRVGMRIRVVGDAKNGFKHDTNGDYDPDADERSKQLFNLGSVNEALLPPGAQACDGTDGCIERHKAEERPRPQACDGTDGCIERHAAEEGPGTLACDGTDGCIERHLNELEKLALSIPAPGKSSKASLWKENDSPVEMTDSQLWLRQYLAAMIDKGLIDEQAQRVMDAAPVK